MTGKFNDGLNVLAYGDIDKLATNMNHHFLDQLSVVSDEMAQEPRTLGELNDYVIFRGITHILIPDEHFHRLHGTLEGCVVPVVELLGDHFIPWAIDRKQNYLIKNGIKDAFVFTERFLSHYQGFVRCHPVLIGFDDF